MDGWMLKVEHKIVFFFILYTFAQDKLNCITNFLTHRKHCGIKSMNADSRIPQVCLLTECYNPRLVMVKIKGSKIKGSNLNETDNIYIYSKTRAI